MEERLDLPRLLVAAPASGSGKTTVTCALLRAFQRRGLDPCAFKCGPDLVIFLHGTDIAVFQVRAGLYRPHVPPGGAGPAQPEPGPVFQRGGPGPRPAVLRRAWPRRGGAGGGHGLLRRRGGHGAGQQLAPGPGHRDPHPAGGAPPGGGPHSGGHGAGAGPVPQSRYDRRASSQWLLPGAGGTAHAHAPKGDGPSGAGLAAPAARLRHRKPAPGPAHAGGGPGAGRQGGPAGQPAGGDGGSGGRPGPGPVRRPSSGGALRRPAGAGGPCGSSGPGPGLLLLL